MKRALSLLLVMALVLGCAPVIPFTAVAAEGAGNIVTVNADLYPESEHEYGSFVNESKIFSWPGADKLEVTFSEDTHVEEDFDFLYLYDATGEQVAVYTGSEAAGKRVELAGDTFTITLISDGSVQSYGYSFASIIAYMSENSSIVDDLAWKVNDGEAIITQCNADVEGNIVIPAILDGCLVTEIGTGAFKGCSGITGITLSSGITTIGAYAFQNCEGLEYVKIAGYKLTDIDEGAFSGCTALKNVWYRGTQGDFAIAEGNDALQTAVWHYEACAKRPEVGDHCFENGYCVYCQKKEYPIVSIEFVQDTVVVVEQIEGSWDGEFIYDLKNHSRLPEYTAVLKDGTRIQSENSMLEIDGDYFYLSDNAHDLQLEETWTVGNTYTVTCNLTTSASGYAGSLPVIADFQVTVMENPVASIEVADISMIEFTNGYDEEDRFMYYMPALQATVTMKDGTTQTIVGDMELYGNHYWINDNAWDMQQGTPWTAGNTYTVAAYFMGCHDPFDVTITQSPVVSIEIEDMTITQLTGGHYWENMYYYEVNDAWFTVTYRDGTTERVQNGVYIDGLWVELDINTEIQHENPWTGGNTYTVSGSLMGAKDDFQVTIELGNIVGIDIQDISVVEYSSGYYEGNTYYYTFYDVNFMLLYRDGTTEIVNSGKYIDGNWWGLHIDTSSQDREPWVAGNTYTVTGTFMGVSDTFNITIKERPIDKIEIEDVTISEYSNGYYNEGVYYYSLSNLKYTVTFQDGHIEKMHGGFYLDGQWCSVEVDTSSQESEPWVAGNTYTVTGYLMGISDTFTVTIKESPIARIEVEDIVLAEYSSGYYAGDTFYYELNNINFTVFFRDGRKETTNYGMYIDDSWYSISVDISSQESEPWVAGNTYTVTGTFMGVSDTFNITITESPIKGFEVEDLTIIEFTNGEYRGDTYYYSFHNVDFTVIYNDGHTERVNGGATVDNQWYNLSVDTSSQEWEPWVAGNTYTVTGTFMGITDTFTVTILENPIARIELQDLSIMEFTGGKYINGKYHYYLPSQEITVYYKDGTIQTVYSYIEMNGETYWYNHNAGEIQEWEDWTAGNTYEVTGTMMGFSDTFQVTIKKGSVESLEIEDISILEGSNGWDYDGYYSIYNAYYTLTFTDGTTLRTNEGLEVDDQWCSLSVDTSSQESEPWVAGNTYTVTGYFMGLSDTFNVTIVPSPIEEITFKNIVLYKGIDSYDRGDYDYYYVDAAISQVQMKNGEVISGGTGITYEGSYYYTSNRAWQSQDMVHWTVGNVYQVTGTLLGVTGTFYVMILDDPIRELELIKGPDNAQCLLGNYMNYQGTVIRIHYQDGDYEDVTLDGAATTGYDYRFYSEKLQRDSRISMEGFFMEAGEQETTISILNHDVTIPVSVKENLAESISIREDDDKRIILTVHNSDNTSYDVKLLDVVYFYEAEEGVFIAYTFTHMGILETVAYFDEGSFKIGLRKPGADEFLESNALDSCEWFDVVRFVSNVNYSVPYLNEVYELADFTGEITKENIDTILLSAGRLAFDYDEYKAEINGFAKVPGDIIRAAVLEYFAVSDVDLTLSANYDAEEDIYFYLPPYNVGMAGKYAPDEITYDSGIWYITTTNNATGYSTIKLKLNEELRILEFSNTTVLPETQEPPVCAVTTENGEFAAAYTWKEALKLADGGTITLLSDVTADIVVLKPGTTLDLNGYTLTAELFAAMKGAKVLDGGEDCIGGGLLKIEKENLSLAQDNGGVIPVWNGVDGYIFTKVSFLQVAYPGGTGAAQYIFLPQLSNTEAAVLLVDGGLDNGLKIKVELTWNNGQSQQFYTYNDALVEKVFASGGRLVFSLTVTGIDGIGDMLASAVVVTDTGAQASNTGMALVGG